MSSILQYGDGLAIDTSDNFRFARDKRTYLHLVAFTKSKCVKMAR